MNRQYLVGTLVVVGLVGTVGVGSAVTGVGPAAQLLEGDQHELLSFESAGAACTNDFVQNSSTSIGKSGEVTQVTHAQNFSIPDPSYAVGTPSFDRLNESAYVLSIPIEETEKEPRGCTGFARYEAVMQIPAGDDPWTIIVEHENETAMTLFGDSNSTGASGSASAGARVSG